MNIITGTPKVNAWSILSVLSLLGLVGCAVDAGPEEEMLDEPITDVQQAAIAEDCKNTSFYETNYYAFQADQLYQTVPLTSELPTNYYDYPGCTDTWVSNYLNAHQTGMSEWLRKRVRVGWDGPAPANEGACNNARLEIRMFVKWHWAQVATISDTTCSGAWSNGFCTWDCTDDRWESGTYFMTQFWDDDSPLHQADDVKIAVRAYSLVPFGGHTFVVSEKARTTMTIEYRWEEDWNH